MLLVVLWFCTPFMELGSISFSAEVVSSVKEHTPQMYTFANGSNGSLEICSDERVGNLDIGACNRHCELTGTEYVKMIWPTFGDMFGAFATLHVLNVQND